MNLSTLQQIGRNYWWLLLIRGTVSVLFGILAVVWPARTILILISLFGVYALVDGIMAAVGSLHERHTSSHWWVLLMGGIAGIIIGLLVFFWPDRTALVLFSFIGIWAIVMGVFELITAFAFSGSFGLEWTLVLTGILSMILGSIFILHPVPSMLSIVWLLGVVAIVYGVVQFVHAFQYSSLVS